MVAALAMTNTSAETGAITGINAYTVEGPLAGVLATAGTTTGINVESSSTRHIR